MAVQHGSVQCSLVHYISVHCNVIQCSTVHTAERFLINLLLTTLKEIIKLQKIYCFSLNKLRLIRRTRTIDQSKTDIKALQYIHLAKEITLILYRQPSTYRRFDSAYSRRPFFSLHHLEYIYEEVWWFLAEPCYTWGPLALF